MGNSDVSLSQFDNHHSPTLSNTKTFCFAPLRAQGVATPRELNKKVYESVLGKGFIPSRLRFPFFAALGFGVLYFGVMAITPFLLMFHSLPDDKARAFLIPGYSVDKNIRYYKTTRAVQLISFAASCGFAYGFSKKALHSHETFMTDSARSFLFGLEMYAKARCTIQPGSRVAFIADERILLAETTPAGMSFSIRDCKRGHVIPARAGGSGERLVQAARVTLGCRPRILRP